MLSSLDSPWPRINSPCLQPERDGDLEELQRGIVESGNEVQQEKQRAVQSRIVGFRVLPTEILQWCFL
jgi:hypothetical protein